ncbi:MAG: hypothetical protein EOM17_11925 [Synergistales bacterium]|nr:hypothetical protein [Synergistales bacterium]
MDDMLDMSPVSIPLLCWGGSPRSLRQRSPAFSDDMAPFVADLEIFLFSNDPPFTALLKEGEHCWVDVPAPDGQHRLFAVSFLYKEPGVRPVWYLVCMLIGREQWRMIGSHRRFFEALRAAAPSLWNDPVFRSENSIELRFPKKTEPTHTFRRDHLLRVGPCPPEDALRTLEQRFPMDDDVCFQKCTVAWNPAMYDPNWSCVVRTKERTIPARSTTPDTSGKKTEEKHRTTVRGSGRNSGRKILLVSLLFATVAVVGGVLLWQSGVDKSVAKEENVNQPTVRTDEVKEYPSATKHQEEVLLSSDDLCSGDLGIAASERRHSESDGATPLMSVSHDFGDMEPALRRGDRAALAIPVKPHDVESKDLPEDEDVLGSGDRPFESPDVLPRP